MKTEKHLKKVTPVLFITFLGAVALALFAWLMENIRISSTADKDDTSDTAATTPNTTASTSTPTTNPNTTPTNEVKSHVVSNVSLVAGQIYNVTFPSAWKSEVYVVEISDETGAAVLADIPPATRLATGFSIMPTFDATNLTIRVIALT